MSNIKDIELKKVNFDFGIEHEKYSAEIYICGRKVGELLDDGWCDELYMEFRNDRNMKRFLNLLKKNKVDDIKGFIGGLLFNKKIYKWVRDKSGFYQLTFLN